MKRTALITAATLLLLAVTVTNATAQNDTATALNATTATDSVSTQRTDTGTVVVKPKAWFSFLTLTGMYPLESPSGTVCP